MTAAAPARARHLAADEERLLACVHCGFCLSACPTYEAVGDENDSPRGRLHLMRALLEDRLDAEGAFARHIGRCLGCRACEPVCPAGVEYGTLLEAARADGLAGRTGAAGRLEALAGRLGLALLAGPARRPLFLLLRAVRASGLAALAGRLPGRAGLAARLLEASRPDRRLHPGAADAEGRAPRAGFVGERRGAGDRGGADDREGADDRGGGGGTAGPTYALLEGCVMSGLFGHVHRATRRALAAAGFRERRAPGQACCGALHAHAGFGGAARRMARRNVAAFEACGVDRIAVNAAGCGAALRDYPRWLAEEAGWAERAGRVAGRVRDVTELLAAGPELPRGRLPGRIAYDAPCHLLHAQGVREQPLRVLGRIADAAVEPLPSSERCCGGAGVYNLLHPDLSASVLAPKLDEVEAGGYEWVATGNPGCVMQVGAGLRARGIPARAVHPVEILDAAGPEPGGSEGWS